VKSTSGWFGGRTSVVVPMTGQDMLKVWDDYEKLEEVSRSEESSR
jgi:hypothetical protein